jgi:hypothetical protein
MKQPSLFLSNLFTVTFYLSKVKIKNIFFVRFNSASSQREEQPQPLERQWRPQSQDLPRPSDGPLSDRLKSERCLPKDQRSHSSSGKTRKTFEPDNGQESRLWVGGHLPEQDCWKTFALSLSRTKINVGNFCCDNLTLFFKY